MQISKELIERCIAHKRVAQKELYTLLLPYLASVCKRYLINSSDVQDALQETFIRLFNNLDKYDGSRSELKTWAVRIAINASLKLNSKLYKLPTKEYEPESIESGVEPEVYSKLTNEEMMRMLKEMPKQYFEVFNMYVIDGFSHQEISEISEIGVELSRQRLSRARKWIASHICVADMMDTKKLV